MYLDEVFAKWHELGLELVLKGTGWRVTPTLQPFGADCHFVWIMGQRACPRLSRSTLASSAKPIGEIRADGEALRLGSITDILEY